MEQVTLRQAREEDIKTLTDLALRAKRYWDYPEEWIELWREDLTFTQKKLQETTLYVAENNGKIHGVYGLIFNGDRAELVDMWVSPDHIGTGLGRLLFEHAVMIAQMHHAANIMIDSDPNAKGFYQHMGAIQVGETPSTPQGRMLPRLAYVLSNNE